MKGDWRQTGKGTKVGIGGEACSCVRMRHKLRKNEDEVSVRSRE